MPMLKIIKELLLKIVEDIDAGNSNLSENDQIEVINIIHHFTDKTERMSKYSACKYLNVSRATFDSYIREGKLPKGKHTIGFKELSWSKKDLDSFINKCHINNNHK